MPYLLLRTLHILAATLFLGNIVVTAVWKTLADPTKDPRIIAYAQRLVNVTDLLFTGPAVVLVTVTGLLMAPTLGGLVDGPAWLMTGLLLMGLSTLLWLMVLIPVQVRQGRMARAFAADGEIPAAYWRLNRVWAVVGTIATILPLLNLYFMVYKPA